MSGLRGKALEPAQRPKWGAGQYKKVEISDMNIKELKVMRNKPVRDKEDDGEKLQHQEVVESEKESGANGGNLLPSSERDSHPIATDVAKPISKADQSLAVKNAIREKRLEREQEEKVRKAQLLAKEKQEEEESQKAAIHRVRKEWRMVGKSNILVVIRVRPLSDHEISLGDSKILQLVKTQDEAEADTTHSTLILQDPLQPTGPSNVLFRSREAVYEFDSVLDDQATQANVYDASAKLAVTQVLKGINATVFCYGATGSGKTYTMMGTPAIPGILQLLFQDLFKRYELDCYSSCGWVMLVLLVVIFCCRSCRWEWW